MEENLGSSQAPMENPGTEGNIGRLENELDELKERARSSNPFDQVPTPPRYSNGGVVIVRIGIILFVVALVIAGIYIIKSLLGRGITVGKKVSSTPSATVSPTPTQNPFTDWKKYNDPSGAYSFSCPLDFLIADYSEDGHEGAVISKNAGFEEKSDKDYVRIRTLLLKGMNTTAKLKSEQLRNQAAALPGQRDKVSQVQEIKVGGKTAYKYTILSTGDMKAEDIVMDAGREMIRIEIEYKFIPPVEGKYEETIGKILDSFAVLENPVVSTLSPSPSSLPKTGFFGTEEPTAP